MPPMIPASMLGRKQSLRGDSGIMGEVSQEETSLESTGVEWINKVVLSYI